METLSQIVFPLNERKTKIIKLSSDGSKYYLETCTAQKSNSRKKHEIAEQEYRRDTGCFISPRFFGVFIRLALEIPEIRRAFLKELYGVRERQRITLMVRELSGDFLDKSEVEKLSLLFSFLKLEIHGKN